MPTLSLEQWREEAGREREMLSAGEMPPPKIKNAQQRWAAKALAGFFSLMVLLTLLSRAADGLTVARVEVAEAKTGILTQRVTVNGTLEAQGDLPLSLPGGIEVLRVVAKVGQRVQAGDVLLELDQEGLESSLEKLRNDLKLLDLRIAATEQGNTSASADTLWNAQEAVISAQEGLRSAQQTLEEAQEDYDRLVQSRKTAESRSAEDREQAVADLEQAEEELEKAIQKTSEELVKAAQEKVDAARETLTELEEAAAEEKKSAQEVLSDAQKQQSSTADSYWNALEASQQADRLIREAQENLDGLMAAEEPDEQAITAAQVALNQAQSVKLQAETAKSSLSISQESASQALKQAKEALQKVTEKWEKELKKAGEKLEKAQAELSEVRARTDMSEEPLVVSARSALEGARRTLHSAGRMEEDTRTSTEDQLRSAQRAIDSAQKNVESARRSLEAAQRGVTTAQLQMENERKNNANTSRQAEIERLGYLSQRRELQDSMQALEAAAASGGVVTAPIAGTVLSIMEEPGKTQEGARVAVISRSDLGFQFTGKLTEKEAENLSLGDMGTISFQQDGKRKEVKGTVSGIGMADEQGNVSVTVRLEGSFPTGASASLEVSKRSEQYRTCLPLSALRSEGSDSYFVLVMREKATIMGKEQTADKVPVTLLAKDSELAAVEAGMLQYGDRVIVSASKPISKGDRIREAE